MPRSGPESLHQSLESIQDFEPLSLLELHGGQLPAREDIQKVQQLYIEMAQAKFSAYLVKCVDGSSQVLMFGQPMDGERINAAAYFAAPDKNKFGLDTRDVLKDWRKLYNSINQFDGLAVIENPDNKARKEAHQGSPGWDTFESERIKIYVAILMYSQQKALPLNRQFVPVMAWTISPAGERKWATQPAELGTFAQVKEHHLGIGVSPAESQYSLIIGSLFAAGYSLEVTSNWAPRSGYAAEDTKPSQTMGATQALPLVLRNAQAYLGSQLVKLQEERLGINPTGRPPLSRQAEPEAAPKLKKVSPFINPLGKIVTPPIADFQHIYQQVKKKERETLFLDTSNVVLKLAVGLDLNANLAPYSEPVQRCLQTMELLKLLLAQHVVDLDLYTLLTNNCLEYLVLSK